MSVIRFISDLHLGHAKILQFSPDRGGTCQESHDAWIVDMWNSVVEKRDHVWILGDMCFNKMALRNLTKMNGQKTLLVGNHDEMDWYTYHGWLDKVKGFTKFKNMWLSHCPIHPIELRGKTNVHGHVHMNTLQDPNYINVSVESLQGVPITLEEIQTIIEKRKTSPEVSNILREELS